jgi:hypothetical protein
VLEIGSAILFLIPLTRDIGLLLVSAYFGGAIATHMGHGEPVMQPAIILAIFWAFCFQDIDRVLSQGRLQSGLGL